jgi:hypothetical protein
MAMMYQNMMKNNGMGGGEFDRPLLVMCIG